MQKSDGKIIIFSAPSGSGKSTIVNHLLGKFPQLQFSISATSRSPRGDEQHGKEYYFLTNEEFARRAAADEFVEWEEVYAGTSYGTLRSEVQRIWGAGGVIVFDVDVRGGVNLKRIFGDSALAIFIEPPSIEALRQRLIGRATDTPEAIERRIGKAAEELKFAPEFDVVIVNDVLSEALSKAEKLVNEFTNK